MTARKNDGRGEEQPAVPAGGPVPAVPPPDDPLERHRQDSDAGDREAARLRLEAILQLRRASEENEEPDEPDGS